MKLISQKFNNFFQLVAGIILVLGLSHSIYHRIKYSEEYNQPLPDYNTIAKNIDTLISPIIIGLPPPNAQERRIRPHGYTHLTYYYNNPSQKLIETVEKNIQSQKNWREVAPRTQDNMNTFKSYCNGEIALNLSNNTIPLNAFDDKTYQQLSIYMYWEQHSDCMGKQL